MRTFDPGDLGYDAGVAPQPPAPSAQPGQPYSPPDLQPKAVPPPPVASPPRMPMPGTASSASTSAGTGVLIAAGGATAGYALGGGWGAGAGLLLTGAIRNALRAQRGWGSPDAAEHQEATKSATMAVFGLGIGGYFAYLAAHRHDDED